MCAIVDANAAHEVFGSSDEQPTSAGEGFFRWLNSGKGKLVVGGKLKEELDQGVPKFRAWALQATLSGKLIDADKSRVDQEAEKARSSGGLKSDDPHIIALAQVSGARLLFSNDKDLHEDFKNRNFINKPLGRIYSTAENKSFTEDKRKLLDRHHCKIVN